jgi:hypothetical protein
MALADTSVDNFYTPLRTLIESASSAGFINPENLSLVKVVDLPGGEPANADPSKASEWGQIAVDAVRDFKFSVCPSASWTVLPVLYRADLSGWSGV